MKLNDVELSETSSSPASTPSERWREIRAEFWLDRYRIGGVLAAGLLLTAVAAALATKRYTAEASLLLRLGREYMYTPEVGDAAGRTPLAYDREQTIQSETRILLSRDVLESAVNKVGAATLFPGLVNKPGPGQRDQAVLQLERALDAELLKGTNLMQVQLKLADPQVAALALSAVIDAYLHKRQSVFSGATGKGAEAEYRAQETRLQGLETRMAEFKQTHGFIALSEEQSLLLAQRNALEAKEAELVLSQAQTAGRAASIKGRLGQVPAEVTLSSETLRSEATESALKLLMDLKLKERDASSKYADTEPVVQDIRQDINLTLSQLKALKADPPRTQKVGRSPVRDATETDLEHTLADQSQAKAGRATLSAHLSSTDKRLQKLAGVELQWRALEREHRLAEADYEAAAKRLRDERVMADLDRQRQSNVSVVQAPKPPLEGRSARAAIVGVGTALSLAAALLTAFVSSLWRQQAKAPKQPLQEPHS
jgi:uncharacterized protein involved in exopolysaccharide biosynthesis